MCVAEVGIIEKKLIGKEKTYNLSVEGTHTYILENGLVVHNCDTVSQLGLIEIMLPSEDAEMMPEYDIDMDYWHNDNDRDEYSGGSTIF